jgi:8-oxo-dGTP pyrophosphatase MutT (NUDIX family)
MALPGGRAAPEDASLQETAERETHEEVGLVLEPAHRLGALTEISILLRGRDRLLYLAPFVYYLGPTLAAFTPNHEVGEVHWIPLAHLWDEQNATSFNLPTQEVSLWYPAIEYRERAVWGITHRVLMLFSDVIGRPLPHLEAIPGLGH